MGERNSGLSIDNDPTRGDIGNGEIGSHESHLQPLTPFEHSIIDSGVFGVGNSYVHWRDGLRELPFSLLIKHLEALDDEMGFTGIFGHGSPSDLFGFKPGDGGVDDLAAILYDKGDTPLNVFEIARILRDYYGPRLSVMCNRALKGAMTWDEFTKYESDMTTALRRIVCEETRGDANAAGPEHGTEGDYGF